jgi:hypothetical protein
MQNFFCVRILICLGMVNLMTQKVAGNNKFNVQKFGVCDSARCCVSQRNAKCLRILKLKGKDFLLLGPIPNFIQLHAQKLSFAESQIIFKINN